MSRCVTALLLGLAIICQAYTGAARSAKVSPSPTTIAKSQKPSDPALRKLQSPLLQIVQAVDDGETSISAINRFAPHSVQDGRLPVLIAAEAITPDLVSAVKMTGAGVQSTQSLYGLHHINFTISDISKIRSLAERSDVKQILLQPAAATQPPPK